MGAVFVAEQIATELTVAIKVLFPHILGSQDAVEKFQFEAKVAARVNSDHIVKVLDAGYDQESGLPFLVMELLQGEELDALVERQGPLSPIDVSEYVRQVASGLDRAHGYVNKNGNPEPIVHRDLKPENIFLSQRESGEAVVKILDFGIAKVLTDTAKVSQEVKGTPLFMAYEQATGAALSPQTDIWALGLIAFYLLTGEIYWKAASNPQAGISALFGEVLSLPLDTPTERLRELGREPRWQPAFDAWFARCVVRDASQRFSTAGEAARELARSLGVIDQLAPPSSGDLDATIAGVVHLGATRPSTVARPHDATVATLPAATPPGMATDNAMGMAHTTPGSETLPVRSMSPGLIAVAALAVVAVIAVVLTRGSNSEETASGEASSAAAPAEVAPGPAVAEREAEPPGMRAPSAAPEVAGPVASPPVKVAPVATPKPPAVTPKPPAVPAPVVDPYGER
jgi:serine/threonine-protein kinase